MDTNHIFVFAFNYLTTLVFQDNSFYTTTDTNVLILTCTESIDNVNFEDSFQLENGLFVHNYANTKPPFDGRLYVLFKSVSYKYKLIDVYISDTMSTLQASDAYMRLNDVTFPSHHTMYPLLLTRSLTYDFEQDFPITARVMDFTIVVQYESSMVASMSIFECVDIQVEDTSNQERFMVIRYHASDHLVSVNDQSYACQMDLNQHHIRLEASRTKPTDSLRVHNLIIFQGHPTIPLDLTEVGSQNNVYIGTRAGYFTKRGKNNIYIGKDTGVQNKDGHHNIFVGHNAGSLTSESTHNICVGENTLTSGDTNILIGNRVQATNDSNHNIIISNDQEIRGDHNIIIGKSSTLEQNNALSIHGLITGDFTTNQVNINGNIRADSLQIGHFHVYVRDEHLVALNTITGNHVNIL